MNFTLNYSPQAAALLRDGQITIDRFKCPPWRDLVAEARTFAPVYIHFDLIAGDGSLSGGNVDWDEIERWLTDTDTPYVNVHLLVRADSVTNDEQALERMIADVNAVVSRFGAEKVIGENIPYRVKLGDELGWKYARVCVDPVSVGRVIEETGIGFLLDTAHARITSANIGMSEQDYIRALPIHRATELHITGLGLVEGMIGDHMPMQDDDWALFDWTMNLIHDGTIREPWCAAFEYGGISSRFDWRSDPDVMRTQVPRMVESIRRI